LTLAVVKANEKKTLPNARRSLPSPTPIMFPLGLNASSLSPHLSESQRAVELGRLLGSNGDSREYERVIQNPALIAPAQDMVSSPFPLPFSHLLQREDERLILKLLQFKGLLFCLARTPGVTFTDIFAVES